MEEPQRNEDSKGEEGGWERWQFYPGKSPFHKRPKWPFPLNLIKNPGNNLGSWSLSGIPCSLLPSSGELAE